MSRDVFQGCTGFGTAGYWLARWLHQLKRSTFGMSMADSLESAEFVQLNQSINKLTNFVLLNFAQMKRVQ